MENIKLNKKAFALILKNRCSYSEQSIKYILAGRNKPSYEVMLKLSKEHGIPFEAWQDIRAWLGLPPTRTQLKLREQACENSNIKS